VKGEGKERRREGGTEEGEAAKEGRREEAKEKEGRRRREGEGEEKTHIQG
jgi:hypothetical protein